MKKSAMFLAVPVLALAALTACGGGSKSTTSTTTTQNQAAASPAASPAGGSMTGGMAAGAAAPVPASLHCGATAPVWANSKSHVYHTSTDPLYGKTKHGQYMCAQTAVAQGYHAAGPRGAMPGSKRHHKSGSMMALPQPSPTY